jgi:hypothetical protein
MTSLSVISHRPAEDHEVVVDDGEPAALVVAFVIIRLLPRISLSWDARIDTLHHVTLSESMLDQTLMVWARLIKHLVEESCPIRGLGPCLIPVHCSNKVASWPLLGCLLLIEPSPGTAIVGILRLLSSPLENRSHCHVTRGEFGRDVQEFLGCARSVSAQLMD